MTCTLPLKSPDTCTSLDTSPWERALWHAPASAEPLALGVEPSVDEPVHPASSRTAAAATDREAIGRKRTADLSKTMGTVPSSPIPLCRRWEPTNGDPMHGGACGAQ
ncbi:hypothetical protein RKD05_000123 [Microbacterium sp. SLBN-111]